MVLLNETHPNTPDSHSNHYTHVATGSSPTSVTMKLEDAARPKVMSVQERIRALNKSTNNETAKSFGWAPGKLRSNNLQAARTKSPVSSPVEQNKPTRLEEETCQAQIRDDELSHPPSGAVTECDSSNSGEVQLDNTEQQEKEEPQQSDKGTLMLDSYLRDDSQLLDEDESDDGATDYGASAAVKYWRRTKGEPESGGTNDIAIQKGIADVTEEQVPVEDFKENNTLSTCNESSDELYQHNTNPSQEIRCESNPVASPEEVCLNQAQDDQIHTDTDGEIMAPPPPQSDFSTSVSSPPDILRTVHSYPDMDAMEPKKETVHHEQDAVKQTDKASDRQEERNPVPIDTTLEKEKPTTTKSFSQRALEKRSRRRAAQQNLVQTPVSPKSNTSEVESASVLSGSTTHSASTIHTTTLSSRATRLLREKRQGNVTKADGLAKSLAQNLLRGKTSSPTEHKSSCEAKSTSNGDEEHGKLKTKSSPTSNCVPEAHGESIKLADNCNNTSEANTQKLPLPVNAIPPSGTSDRRHANTTMNLPVGYQMQRQPSHVSPQYANSVQFGRSPSFQNVEVGIATGPTIYPTMPYGAPPSLNPVAGIPYAPCPSPRYTPNRPAPIPNDLLVQPKFSRYNSFDVTNPKPAPIKNVLTEDSASWDDSQTQDETQDGTSTQDSFSFRNGAVDGQESCSTGHNSNSRPPSIESLPRLDSFPKGKSFDHGCAVLEQLQNACDHLSPKSCNSTQIIPNSSMNDLIHVQSTFSNTEDVAIEVEYVTQSQEPEQEEMNVDDHTAESYSIYSLSTREMEMESKDSYSVQ